MNVEQALNKLAKWRSVFAGWQLGTRPKGDPESDAVRDHREVTILLRTDVNALTQLLIAKKIFTQEEFQQQLINEAQYLDKRYEEKFPGIKTTSYGVSIDPSVAADIMKNWQP